MRNEINKLKINGEVVIGEGELDKAPMLYIGEKLGLGGGLTARRQGGMMAMVDHIKKLSGAKAWPHQQRIQ